MPIDALSVSYAQLTRDLLTIAKFLFHTPFAFDAPVRGGGGRRRNIVIPFGTEKLEWWG